MMFNRIFLMVFVVVGCSLHFGCATTGLTSLAGDVFVPPEQEKKLGNQLSQEIEKEYPICDNEDVVSYVDKIGASIADAAAEDRADLDYRFSCIKDDEQVNAFALPGGYSYVFTGLMLYAENEAQLASVMAHEVSHIVARHSANRLGSQMGLSMLSSIALGENPGMLKEVAVSLATTGSMLKFSRDDEREADRLGMKYMISAGYDPQEMVDFMKKLQQKSDSGSGSGSASSVEAFFSTHPLTSERIDNLQRELDMHGKVSGRIGKEELERIQGIIRSE